MSLQSITGDRAVETREWRHADLTGKNGLFVGDNININQNIGTRHWLKPPWTSDLSAFWNEQILFVYWKFSGIYCRERFDTSLLRRGFSIVPRALSIFSIIAILMGIPSGSLCGGERVSTQAEEQQLCKTYTRWSELFRTNHFWCVDKVSDEVKPHNKKQEIPQRSLIVLTFFYRKSFLLQFLQSPATCSIREKSNFTNLVIEG